MSLGVSKRMLAGFVVELALFATAAVLSADHAIVLALLGGGVLVAVALSLVLSHGIARTAREMAGAARGLAEGDVEQEILVRSHDDLGRIADAFRDMVAYQRDMARVADAIGRGDLASEIAPKSERDVFGHAFVRMQASLRDLVDKLERQALFDGLTELPNRTLLHDRLGQALRAARRDGEPLALLLLDLDRFKEVNDTFGHHHGDLLLVEVAGRLAAALRDCDTFARLGGDEFAVVLPGADAQAAAVVANRVLAALRRPFALDGTHVEAGASIGVATYPQHGDSPDTLLRRADIAMYQAKQSDLGQCLYEAEHDETSPERVALVADLRRGIAEGELELHYQPKLSCSDGQVPSVEALVRWRHGVEGLIPPDRFIPLAEQTGLIRELTEWVLRTALRQCARWRDDGLDVDVAVNVSARNLRDERLPGLVAEVLASERLQPRRLIVEITETALMLDPARAMETLAQLRDMGVRIAIDDFGTGYSSLAYLQRLPAHELKIDRSFVQRLLDGGGDAAIVRSTIALGHDLGLSVVAEGVEDAETLALLSDAGCDLAQGYVLTRPVPPDELVAWLYASPWAPHAVRERATAAGD